MPSVTLLDPGVIDPQALHIVDPYAGQVNATTFGQGLASHQVGSDWWQYAAWYGGNGHIRVGRKGPAGVWEVAELPHVITDYDSHNVLSLGVSPADGRLHLAGDCHRSPVAYTRTATGSVDNPESFAWTPNLFEPFSATLAGTVVGDITYPVFFPTPEGLLQLAYRIGTSSSGRMALAEYDGTWTLLGSVTQNIGNWTGPNGQVSGTRNFYYGWPTYTADGRLHVMGTWREGDPDVKCAPTSPIPNHHSVYLRSDDRGRTWRNSGGVQVGTTETDPVTVADPGILVDSTTGIQYALQVDSAGAGVTRPALVQSFVRGGLAGGCVETEQERIDKATNTIRYQRADGVWTYTVVAPGGADWFLKYLGRAGRSQLVIDASQNFYVIQHGCRILAATAPNYTDWAQVFNGPAEGFNAFGECLMDTARVLSDGIVSVGYQRVSTGTTPSAFCVRDFQLGG